MPSILFVCTANRIRSPFAAAYFIKLLTEGSQANPKWKIESAGTWAKPDHPVDPVVLELAPAWNLNFGDHKTKQVNDHLLKEFDLILVMEKGQKEALHYEFPKFAHKIFLLTEICAPPYDFPDPQGFQSAQMQKCLNEIASFLESNYIQICEKAISLHN